jgi:phosphomannomutase
MGEAPRFGTSGLRGLVTELTDDLVARHTRAFLRHLGAGDRLLVGRDLRDSSPRIAAAVAAGAAAEGVAVTDCGALPTPALAFEAMRLRVPAIMVTGSHISADRNGLKFYRADGEIDKADEAGIAALLPSIPSGALPAPATTPSTAALDRYIARYTALAPAISLRGARIGVYEQSSVARDILVKILDALGADVLPLGRAETFVPVDTEALRAEDTALVHGWAAEHGLDAIVSTDGDADRPLIANENGVFLRGDVVGLLTAKFLGAATVVTPVTSTSAVELSGAFPTVIRTKVGSPHVIGAMEGATVAPVVGFEANGGVLVGSEIRIGDATLAPLPTRDALLPIIAVLASERRAGRSLSALVAGLPQRHTESGLIRDVTAAESAPFVARLATDHAFAADLIRHGIERADTTDGTKLMLTSGDTVHFRASGNAPELRCYAESDTAAGANRLVDSVLDRVRIALGKA